MIRDGSEYFGPYTFGRLINTLLELINKLYKLRTQPGVVGGEYHEEEIPCLPRIPDR